MAVISGGKIIEGAKKRQPAFSGTGAPTVNVTGLGQAVVGDLYVNTANGWQYSVAATDGATTISWVSVGTQT